MKTTRLLKLALLMPFIAFTTGCNNQPAVDDDIRERDDGITATDDRDRMHDKAGDKKHEAGEKDMKEFAKKMASDGRMEVNMARMAIQRSQNTEVRNLAQTIRDDHETANARLRSIADAKGWNLPNDMMEKHQEKFRELQQVSDEDFDRRYVDMLVEHHEKAVEKFEKMSKDRGTEVQGDPNLPADRGGQDMPAGTENQRTTERDNTQDRTTTDAGTTGDHPRMQAWIDETLPVLRRHLQRSRQLQKQMQ